MHSYRKNYPRPQLVRENWELLDGQWEFAFDDANKGETEKWYQGETSFPTHIQVPYTYETQLSGIGDETVHNVVWYQRSFTVSEGQLNNKKLILHFEGIDFYAKVWVNGNLVGTHKGAYARISFDISDYVCEGENKLVVRVWDSLDPTQPRGKQRIRHENYACWYVQTTGIWKSVWMEYTNKAYIDKIKTTSFFFEKKVAFEVGVTNETTEDLKVSAKIFFDGHFINEVSATVYNGECKLEADLLRQDLFDFGIFDWKP